MVLCEDMRSVIMVAVVFHKELRRVQDQSLVGTSSLSGGRQLCDNVI